YWDIDGASQGSGINPITVNMNAPHTATAHYTQITYTLTIETTTGGTTNPTPGTYTYAAGSTVQVTAIPSSGYIFDHWELNGSNVGSANPYTVNMNNNYILKAFFKTAPSPLSVSITPMSASIIVGQQVTFTSTVTGGTIPYKYQWYLNGNPLSGATSSSWTFTPTSAGIYYVYLKVVDANNNTAQSDTARITVSSIPVGGYSISLVKKTQIEPIAAYALVLGLFGALLTLKRKRK
ncbi:MAG: PKD domain-containing protein, partial [Candidatus Bathyarchaeales archaeon]